MFIKEIFKKVLIFFYNKLKLNIEFTWKISYTFNILKVFFILNSGPGAARISEMHVPLEDEQLKKVRDISVVLNKEERTICCLYNAKGGLLVKEGAPLPEKVKKMAVFAQAKYLPPEEHEEQDYTIDQEKDHSFDIQEETCPIKKAKKEKLAKQFGEKLVTLYDTSVKQIEKIFTRSFTPEQTIKITMDIVRQSINKDKFALSKCIFSLRDTDTYTYNHSMSVYTIMMQALDDFKAYQDMDIFWDTFKQQYAKVNFSPGNLANYGLGALLHDLGKTRVPAQILNKPGKLSDKEFLIMQQHTVYGVNMLKEAKIDDPQVLQLVGNHHPAYPAFRQVVHNPLVTILNIIDIYDALRSKRVYKDPLPWEDTRSILEKERLKNKWNTFIFETMVHKVLTGLEEHHQEIEI